MRCCEIQVETDENPGYEISFELADQYVGIARDGPDLICEKCANVYNVDEDRFTDEPRFCCSCQEKCVTDEMYEISKNLKLWKAPEHMRDCTGLNYKAEQEDGEFHVLCTDCLDFYRRGADPNYWEKRKAKQDLDIRKTKRHKS